MRIGDAIKSAAKAVTTAVEKGVSASGKAVAAAAKPAKSAASKAPAKAKDRATTVTKAKQTFRSDVAKGKVKKSETHTFSRTTDEKTGALKSTSLEKKKTSVGGSATTIDKKTVTRNVGKDGKTQNTVVTSTSARKDAGGMTKTETSTTRGRTDTTETKKKLDLTKASASKERTVTSGTKIDTSREVLKPGASSVKAIEDKVGGKALYKYDLMKNTETGKAVAAWVDDFNKKYNLTAEIPKDRQQLLGSEATDRYGVSHEGSINLGVGIDKPSAKLTVTTRGVEGDLSGGAKVGLYGDYALKYKSPEGTVSGIRLRNDTELKVTGLVGAELKGNAGFKVAPLKGSMIASAGGEAFIGAKIGGDLSTGVSRVRKGADGKDEVVSLAKVTGTAEGWAGAGIAGEAKVGIDNWKISYKLSGGVAWGLGGKLGVSGEIDVKETAVAVGEGVWNALPKDVREEATKRVDDVMKDVGGAVDDVKKKAGDVKASVTKFFGF